MSTNTDEAPVKQEEQSPKHVAQPQQPQTYRQVAATHIDTLSEINRQVPKMLTYFATALSQLTNNPIRDPDQEDTLETRQAEFRKFSLYVNMIVSEIREELIQQVNDLELCKVIPKTHPKYTAVRMQGEKADSVVNDPEKNVRNGGYGEFDVGVLNARASTGQIGGEHVLDRVKNVLDELIKRSGELAPNGDEMVVDD